MTSLLLVDVLSQVAASPTVQVPIDVAGVVAWALKGLVALCGAAVLWAVKAAVGAFQALKAEMGKRLDGIDDSLGTVQSDVKSMKQELFGVTGNNGMRRDLRRTRELQVKHDRLLVELATKAGIPAKLEMEEHD